MRVIKKGYIVTHSLNRKKNIQKMLQIDDNVRHFIRRIMYEFYSENKVPTLELIREKLNDFPDYYYKCLEKLRRVLIDCGIKYKKLTRVCALWNLSGLSSYGRNI